MRTARRVIPFGFDRVFETAATDAVTAPLGAEAAMQIAALRAAMDRMTELHEAELLQTRQDAFEAGRHGAGAEQHAALLAAVDALQDMLGDIDERLAAATDAIKQDAAEIALAAAELLAGHAVSAAPARAISEALGRALRQVARGTQLDIRVHPDLLDAVNGCVEEHKDQTRRKLAITVIADATITPGDATIGWDEGGLAIDAATRRQAVLDELAPLLITWPLEPKEIAPARIA
ncbi:FliH/SctL family protein [Sphingomonas qilianensis]|uniref:Flagellar assembly protein FliH n=1 Tax=Sphingomonas qilianensis TaxID=1736690 RepID=A0ABU9XQQ5_9SPHN